MDKKPDGTRPEPQITEIAGIFATQFPIEGVDPADATQAWRHTLRYARSTGTVEELTDLIEKADPDDPTLKEACDALKS